MIATLSAGGDWTAMHMGAPCLATSKHCARLDMRWSLWPSTMHFLLGGMSRPRLLGGYQAENCRRPSRPGNWATAKSTTSTKDFRGTTRIGHFILKQCRWPFVSMRWRRTPPFGRESLLARQPLRGMLRQVAGLVHLLQIHRTPDSTRGTSTSGRLMEQRRKSKARGWNQRGTWARSAKSLLRTWARMHLLTPGMPRPASRC
mmetsp:Transcript_4431/g.12585  ORF Transcript_4431/g.12585 Transcript_4431/m.12585 type:complete len:202 (+) Transcript_4431:550-1155(+)